MLDNLHVLQDDGIQTISSKNTSQKLYNKVYSQNEFKPNSLILDYGGGKYNVNTLKMKERNCTVLVLDKYHTPYEQKLEIINILKQHQPDYVICSNVLNVIPENEILEQVMEDLVDIAGNKAETIISVYTKNNNNISEITSSGYQRNTSLKSYLPLVKRYFSNVSIKKGMIYANNKNMKGKKTKLSKKQSYLLKLENSVRKMI